MLDINWTKSFSRAYQYVEDEHGDRLFGKLESQYRILTDDFEKMLSFIQTSPLMNHSSYGYEKDWGDADIKRQKKFEANLAWEFKGLARSMRLFEKLSQKYTVQGNKDAVKALNSLFKSAFNDLQKYAQKKAVGPFNEYVGFTPIRANLRQGSSNLKKQLIKLGSTNPELRPHIREILKASDKIAGANDFYVPAP